MIRRRRRADTDRGIFMGRKRTCDPEAVLEAFARNLPLAEISRALGDVPIGTLGAIIHRARRAGDPRAALRRRGSPPINNPGGEPGSAHIRRRQLAREFPSNPDELSDARERSTVPVRRLKAGPATLGWRPSWMRT
jgi:hypothetical protein